MDATYGKQERRRGNHCARNRQRSHHLCEALVRDQDREDRRHHDREERDAKSLPAEGREGARIEQVDVRQPLRDTGEALCILPEASQRTRQEAADERELHPIEDGFRAPVAGVEVESRIAIHQEGCPKGNSEPDRDPEPPRTRSDEAGLCRRLIERAQVPAEGRTQRIESRTQAANAPAVGGRPVADGKSEHEADARLAQVERWRFVAGLKVQASERAQHDKAQANHCEREGDPEPKRGRAPALEESEDGERRDQLRGRASRHASTLHECLALARAAAGGQGDYAPAASRGGSVVTIGMNYTVRAGKEKVFEDACARVVEVMQGTSGHEKSEIYRRIGEGPATYLVVSRWSGEEAFRSFVSSEAFKKVTSWGALNILEGPPRHTTYREG